MRTLSDTSSTTYYTHLCITGNVKRISLARSNWPPFIRTVSLAISLTEFLIELGLNCAREQMRFRTICYLYISTPTAAAPNAQFSDEGRLNRSESWNYAATIYSGACGPIFSFLQHTKEGRRHT